MAAPELELEFRADPAHYVYFDLSATGKALVAFSVVLYGYTLVNPSGAATAAINLYDGTDTSSAEPILPLTFAVSESLSDWFGPNGILFKNGVYANVTSGEVKGSVFYRHVRAR